ANSGGSSLNTPLAVSIGPGLGSGFEDSSYVFEGAIISNGNKTYRVKMKDDDSEKLDTAKWAGYTSKYFLFAAASNSIFKQAEISPVGSSPAASVKTDFIVNPNDRIQAAFDIYIGPKYYQDLKALNLSLQKSMDYGWFYFIAIPMLYILNYLYGIIHNYGVAIIILTVIVKAVTLPLTLKSMISMKEMSKLQPKVLELKEKYKNDQAKLNQATMDLYREHKVNPLSGCLPLLLQIPIFFALYKALLLSLELKDAAFFGWLTDLSAKDPYYITPIIMGLTMFIQQKMTPSTADPVQQKIFLAMPVIFTFLFINFPSGLVIYWLTNNVLAIIQQYIINKRRA
ncbi:MAG: membrane protein insertase YidC, partial [Mucispirillum sp.]|nr:membrane protein insertase YidC [Mucispirillum sp.]